MWITVSSKKIIVVKDYFFPKKILEVELSTSQRWLRYQMIKVFFFLKLYEKFVCIYLYSFNLGLFYDICSYILYFVFFFYYYLFIYLFIYYCLIYFLYSFFMFFFKEREIQTVSMTGVESTEKARGDSMRKAERERKRKKN
jgi:hypothetical protein